jgi:BirA family biotin operon repressor/biotin-[acetyl-CoA-carboxylase] ligase
LADPLYNTAPGQPFIELETVDSTNNYARGLIHAGMAQHGTAIFTQEQVAGKGQRGRSWDAEKGKNILLSIILKPAPGQNRETFNLVAGIAITTAGFIKKYVADDVCIKWPNDIYWQDRKAGGILIENIVSQQVSVNSPEFSVNENRDWTIAGIGININQVIFPDSLKNPVSLKQITGKTFEVTEMAKSLAEMIIAGFDEMKNESTVTIQRKYYELLYKKGQTVKLKKGSRVFDARILSVLPDGKLEVMTGIVETFEFGEVTFEV